jgi:AraC-like DNA-binding protein
LDRLMLERDADVVGTTGGAPAQTAPDPPQVEVWDSRYGPASQAFSRFREAVCSAFMPWTPELLGSDFHGRVQSVALENGAVGRVHTSSIVARKTARDIANSSVECLHGNYVLSGELQVEQAGERTVAKRGELVLYHSHLPTVLTEKPDCGCDNLAFIIPTARLRTGDGFDAREATRMGPARRPIEPLIACLDMLTRELSSSSPAGQLSALLDACACLLPISLDDGHEAGRRAQPRGRHGLLGDVMGYIDQNIADPDLRPRQAAERFGISERYVHKLFIRSGTTFGGYVTAERLERIRSELIAMSAGRPPISELAFRWGFADISTFNRAFKRRFGRTPKDYRA